MPPRKSTPIAESNQIIPVIPLPALPAIPAAATTQSVKPLLSSRDAKHDNMTDNDALLMAQTDLLDDAPPPLLIPSNTASTSQTLKQHTAILSQLQPNNGKPSSVRIPQIKILSEHNENILAFSMSIPDLVNNQDDESIANSLRITMETDVPTFAVDRTVVHHNSSTMTDNKIHARLETITFWTNRIDDYPYHEDCPCGLYGCDRCALPVTCDVTGDAKKQITYVTTLDLKMPDKTDIVPVDVRQYKTRSATRVDDIKTGKISQWIKPMLLFKLGQHQRLHFTAYLRKGNGAMHAKWRPTLIAGFNFASDIRLDQTIWKTKLTMAQRAAFLAVCPSNVFVNPTAATKGKVPAPATTVAPLAIEDSNRCIYCKRCMLKAETFGYPDLVYVDQKRPQEFRFIVQSKGSMSAREIVSRGMILLRDRLLAQRLSAQQWVAANPHLSLSKTVDTKQARAVFAELTDPHVPGITKTTPIQVGDSKRQSLDDDALPANTTSNTPASASVRSTKRSHVMIQIPLPIPITSG